MEQHEYVRQVLAAYRSTPGTAGLARRADRLFAVQLFERGVSLETVANALRSDGEFRFSTDHEDYFKAGCPVVDACPKLKAAPLWNYADDPVTDFQKDFEAEGRPTWRKVWRKTAP